MLYEGSFWILCDNNCFDKTGLGFLSFNPEESTEKNLEILFRQEYKNISENCILTRILLERYSDNQIAIYVSTRLQHAASALFSHLSQNFTGALTMTDVRGPLALNIILQGTEFDHTNISNLLYLIDQFECIQPIFIRDKIAKLIKSGEVVEY